MTHGSGLSHHRPTALAQGGGRSLATDGWSAGQLPAASTLGTAGCTSAPGVPALPRMSTHGWNRCTESRRRGAAPIKIRTVAPLQLVDRDFELFPLGLGCMHFELPRARSATSAPQTGAGPVPIDQRHVRGRILVVLRLLVGLDIAEERQESVIVGLRDRIEHVIVAAGQPTVRPMKAALVVTITSSSPSNSAIRAVVRLVVPHAQAIKPGRRQRIGRGVLQLVASQLFDQKTIVRLVFVEARIT